jgi:hypothetical protein
MCLTPCLRLGGIRCSEVVLQARQVFRSTLLSVFISLFCHGCHLQLVISYQVVKYSSNIALQSESTISNEFFWTDNSVICTRQLVHSSENC